MKLTIVGDPHAKPDNLDKIEQLFGIVNELGNETIWMGDMLDTKEVVRSRCLNTWLDQFKGSRLRHTILVGNHDWHNLECKEHSLRPLEELPGVTVVSKPKIIQFEEVTLVRKAQVPSMGFMPYYHDFAKFRYDLKVIGDVKILFIHQGITGFDYGNGYIAHNEIDLPELKSFPMVISGHFHKYQQKDNLTYLGTPFSHSFGESNQEKFIAVLDTETQELELISTPFPKHRTTTVNVSGDGYDDMNRLKLVGASPEDYWRVILTGSQEKISLFRKEAFPDVKWIEKPDQSGAQSDLVMTESDSNEVKFKKWAEEVKEFDEDTVNLGIEIIRSIGV